MPWNKHHKQQTRQKIVDAAASAFRARGAGGVGLSEVMHHAGLTHGGFYAHFKSKDDLIAAALKSVNTIRVAQFRNRPRKQRQGSGLETAIDVYLTSRHREHPEDGCTIATLGSELARESGRARRQISENAVAWLEEFAQCAPSSNVRTRKQQATGTFAAMIGGLILARAVEDPHEADRILADVRAFLHDALKADV